MVSRAPAQLQARWRGGVLSVGNADDADRFRVPDTIAELPGFLDLLPVDDDPPPQAAVPALDATRRDDLGAALRQLGIAAGQAALSVGDGFRALAAQLGVHGPHRILALETRCADGPVELFRAVFADGRRVIDLTAETAPAPLWQTACTLFDAWARRLRVLGEQDHVIVFDLDLRRAAGRTVRARLTAQGEPDGPQGAWTTVLRPLEGSTGSEIATVRGADFDRVVSRLERLLLRYRVQFVQWPDANVPNPWF